MAMNRETEAHAASGRASSAPTASRRATRAASRATRRRARPRRSAPAPQFVKEVRGELRKVAWPTRAETINYSLIVLVTLVVMTAFIFGLDWVFGEVVLRLFDSMSSS